jgi:tRNA A-37 threonylcarbamoyl transferase component Bud32
MLETLPAGARLGRYELIRRFASGGMAEVYLARAVGISGFEKIVALKRILPQYAQRENFVRMFLDEARLTAAIQHNNVAQVYDVGECDDGLFFAMEYVHGADLRTVFRTVWRRKDVMPLADALTVVIDAAAGLHAAHERTSSEGEPLGIIHRDVTPSNILVSFDGCVKLIDFGIAKAERRSSETETGRVKGKLGYMSPEQCRGRPLDRRSDVFSLGIVLFEATTGTRLFAGDSHYSVLRQIVDKDAPRPSSRRREYPPALEAIVMRALARNPADRYPSALAMQIDLEEMARAGGIAISSAHLGAWMCELLPERAAEPLVADTRIEVVVIGRPPLGPGESEVPALGTGPLPSAERGPEGESGPGVALAPSTSIEPPPLASAMALASTRARPAEQLAVLPRQRRTVATAVGLGVAVVVVAIALLILARADPPSLAGPPAPQQTTAPLAVPAPSPQAGAIESPATAIVEPAAGHRRPDHPSAKSERRSAKSARRGPKSARGGSPSEGSRQAPPVPAAAALERSTDRPTEPIRWNPESALPPM